MVLVSPAFDYGCQIPERHTCRGFDTSPPLTWSGVPSGARTLLLTCHDPDATGGVCHHWATYGISPTREGLAEGESGPLAALNDFGRCGYSGPCPLPGERPHRFVFRLYALGTQLWAPPARRCVDIRLAAGGSILATGELMGRFGP
jgi:Raf kinase inhibitor-like YbhB/YbcL family protein